MSKRELKALGITSSSTQPPVADPPPPPSFLDLPEDLQRAVLNRLPLRDKIQAQPVCKDFRRLLLTEADAGSWGSVSIRKYLEDVRDDPEPQKLVTWSSDGGEASLMFWEKLLYAETIREEEMMDYETFLCKVVEWLVRGGDKGGRRLARLSLDLKIIISMRYANERIHTAFFVDTLRDAGFEGVLCIQGFDLWTANVDDGDISYGEECLQSACDALSRSETFTTEVELIADSDNTGKGSLRALSCFVECPRVQVVGLVLKGLWAESEQVLNQAYPMLAPTLRRLMLYSEGYNEQGCPALTFLTCMSNLEELVLNGRAILSQPETAAVASLSASLRRLEIQPEDGHFMKDNVLSAFWAQIGLVVSGLTRLTELNFSLIPIKPGPGAMLASLPPLRLPSGPSQQLKIGLCGDFRYVPEGPTSLTLECFEDMSNVMALKVRGPCRASVRSLCFGPSISHLGALRFLTVDTISTGYKGKRTVSLAFPPELSQCTALKEIRIRSVSGPGRDPDAPAVNHTVPGWALSESGDGQEEGWEVWRRG